MTSEAAVQGGGEGGESAVVEGAEGATNITDDGQGGTASMLSGDDATKTENGDDTSTGKLDLKALLGEELSGDKNITKFLESENPVQEIAKSLVEAQKQVGKQQYAPPPEDASDEQKAAFREAIGVPKEAEGYEFVKPEGVPDELFDAEHAQKWADLMLQNNVPKEAANALRDALMEEQIASTEAATTALNEALDKEFGDQKSVVTKEIGDLLKEAVSDAALRETLEKSLNDEQTPAFALALGKVMQHMKKTYGLSDKNNDGEDTGSTGKSIDELRNDAQKLMSSDAYRDGLHKNHAETVRQVNQMYQEIGQLTAQAGSK